MLISIIIPHLNQPQELQRCLASLASQKGTMRSVEIIVIDNGSRNSPAEYCNALENARLLHEPEVGPGPARNRGVANARGDILAFIDADCIASSDWLSVIEREIEGRNEFCALGGDVRVGYSDRTRPKFWEPYENVYSYRNEMHIAEGYSGTGNLAMRRQVFAWVGPFAGLNVAEDREWGLRAKRLGISTRFVPQMIVYHPARSSFRELERKWDRHVQHDFAEVKSIVEKCKWTAKGVAMIGSPLKEIPNILSTGRVAGPYERWLVFACLVRVRLYRAYKMLTLALLGNSRQRPESWNRNEH